MYDPEYLKSGSMHSCAIRFRTGELMCWGQNHYCQTYPIKGFEKDTTLLAVGSFHTCALRLSKMSLWCWGRNDYGQARVPDELGVSLTKIDAGWEHTCVIRDTGTAQGVVLCWGNDNEGQTTGFQNENTDKEGYGSISAGWMHSCAIKKNQVDPQGFYEVPAGSSERNKPKTHFEFTPPSSIDNPNFNFSPNYITESRKVFCWGDNSFGQTNIPFWVKNTETMKASLGHTHSCAVLRKSNLVCWGGNLYGQSSVPFKYMFAIYHLSVGVRHTCAVNRDIQANCWGSNDFGQTEIPEIFNGKHLVSISGGDYHTCGISIEDEKIKCWGDIAGYNERSKNGGSRANKGEISYVDDHA